MKHTKEHAESVFKSRMEGFPEDINFITMKGIFTEGYMTAIKETNTPELLEALKFSNRFPLTTTAEWEQCENKADELGWIRDIPLEHFARQLRNNAIKKSTE